MWLNEYVPIFWILWEIDLKVDLMIIHNERSYLGFKKKALPIVLGRDY